jgi:hypothetical protein
VVKIFSKLAVLSALSLLVANCAQQNPVSSKDSDTQEVANASFTPQGAIATRLAPDGRVWLMARSTDNRAWYRSKPSNGSWTGWTAAIGGPYGSSVSINGNIAMVDNNGFVLGGSTGGIVALSTASNSLVCASTNSATATFSNWGYVTENNTNVTLRIGDIAAINGNDNIVYVFYRRMIDNCFGVWYFGNGLRGSSEIGNLRKIGPKVAVGKNQDGHLEAFATNSANQLVHTWQTKYPTDPQYWYPDLISLGGNIMPGSDIAVGANADGRLEVFVTWADGTMYHIWQVVPNGGWSNWAQMSPVASVGNTISVGKNSNGTLETIFRYSTERNCIQHQWQLAPGGTTGWSWPTMLTAYMPVMGIRDGANIAITNYANGALVAFVFGSYPYDPNSPNIYYTYQDYTTYPDGWSHWAPLE